MSIPDCTSNTGESDARRALFRKALGELQQLLKQAVDRSKSQSSSSDVDFLPTVTKVDEASSGNCHGLVVDVKQMASEIIILLEDQKSLGLHAGEKGILLQREFESQLSPEQLEQLERVVHQNHQLNLQGIHETFRGLQESRQKYTGEVMKTIKERRRTS
ncbi:hypothetical protein B0H34DRAFT_448551 [Crassisporium funariophilum]|nr:hypothetical protein B0H34DRAFT_448551 [Crassisporium funariophilum]